MRALAAAVILASMPAAAFAQAPAVQPAYPYPYPYQPIPPQVIDQRLGVLNAELTQLHAEREAINYRLPLALGVVGGIVELGTLGLWASSNCSPAFDTQAECAEKKDRERLGYVTFAVGGAMIAVGVALGVSRFVERNILGAKIRTKVREAMTLQGLPPGWGVVPTRGGGSLVLAFHF